MTDNIRTFGQINIPLAWSSDGQFFLSLSDAFGYLETCPYRIYKDGWREAMGDSIKCLDSRELERHLYYANKGDFSLWDFSQPYWEDEDVCRNGKPIAECECC
jgi:hypothetical protein